MLIVRPFADNAVQQMQLRTKYLYKLHMGESFQDYSWIQDFEADFPQKIGLKMLNYADFNSFSDLFSIHLWAIDHLYLKLLTLCRHTASFESPGFWNF